MLSSWQRTKGSTARRLQMVSGPTAEPVSFALQKAMLKIGNVNSSDFVISSKIAAARTLVERKINRKLVQQTWDLFLDSETYVGSDVNYYPLYASFGDSDLAMPEITLPLPPVQSVIGVYVTNDTGTETQVDTSVYFVTKQKEPCRIRLNAGQVWPPHRGPECFRIRFTCGYVIPFSVSGDGVTILAKNTGYSNGDVVRFSSIDGILPDPLDKNANYTVSSLSPTGFQIIDSNGSPVTGINTQAQGTYFLSEVPPPLVEAVALVSGLNQGGEIPSRILGTSARLSPISLPISPEALIADYIWPFL